MISIGKIWFYFDFPMILLEKLSFLGFPMISIEKPIGIINCNGFYWFLLVLSSFSIAIIYRATNGNPMASSGNMI